MKIQILRRNHWPSLEQQTSRKSILIDSALLTISEDLVCASWTLISWRHRLSKRLHGRRVEDTKLLNSCAGCSPRDGATVLELRGHARLGGRSELWRLEVTRSLTLYFLHVSCAWSLESAEHGLLFLADLEQRLACLIFSAMMIEPASKIWHRIELLLSSRIAC